MSFSQEIKQELLSVYVPRRSQARWLASGLFLHTRRCDEQEMSLASELEGVADLYEVLARRLLGKQRFTLVRQAARSQRKALYIAEIPEQADRTALITQFSAETPGQEEFGPYLAGAYLACGNMSDPRKNYHLEFVLRDRALRDDLAGLLETAIPGVRTASRRDSYIAYYKECAQIEDLLTLMGATKSSLAVIDIEMIKEVRNRANRVTNCETANIDKVVSAAHVQVEDIRLILDKAGESALPETVREAARLRLENPDLSLSELSALLETPLSRSGMHHRFRKIAQIAASLRQET